MHWLIITDRDTGGVPVTIIDLARGLAEAGDQVTLLASPLDGLDLLPAARAAGVVHQPWPGQTTRVGLRALWRVLHERRWDAVLSLHRGCDTAVGYACRLTGQRHVIALHGDPAYEAASTRFPKLRNWLWYRTIARAAPLICISQFVAQRARDVFPHLPPIVVVPNAHARQPPAARPVAFPAGRPRLVACGRVYNAKHPELLRPLVQAIAEHGLDVEAVWIGGGDQVAALNADAAAHGMGDRVRFIGHRDDPRSELEQSHVFVHFCTIEGFGLAVIEALAAGLPVIAFEAGALPELIRTNREGVLVPPHDLAAMAAAIAQIFRDPAAHQRLAQAALLRAADFSRSTMTAGYRQALALTANQAVPSPESLSS